MNKTLAKSYLADGGTILPNEIEYLDKNNIAKVYSPDEGTGLVGMVKDAINNARKINLTDESRFRNRR